MRGYRQDSHVFSLSFWALLCAALAFVLFVRWGRPQVDQAAVIAALLIFGPVGLALYLVRARRVYVAIDSAQGILVSGKQLLPWPEIDLIERRRPLLRSRAGPGEIPAVNAPDLAAWAPDPGWLPSAKAALLLLAMGIMAVAVLFVFWVIFFVLVPMLLVPVLEVFAPFGDRIKIVTRSGTLRLRDLRDADDFMRQIPGSVRVISE